MAAHSTISEFCSTQETWTAYIERLEQYLATNKVEDADQQRAILLCLWSSNLSACPQFGFPQVANTAQIQGNSAEAS